MELFLLLLVAIGAGRLAGAEPLEMGKACGVPQTFTDELLPESQRQGTLIKDLGRVKLLDTYLKPMLDFHTTFAIFNNRKQWKRDIVIKPNTYASLGSEPFLEQGPYHFELEAMLASGFDASKRTVIMIPGYRTKANVDWIVEARELWLQLEPEANVIEVNWTDSNQCTYSRAVANTVIIARQTTIFLHYLAELSGTSLKDEHFLERIHLIGHSLGAHIVGFVGKDLAGKVGRITALDPAGPTFDQFSASQRLDRDDARLVEVIHTNAGVLKYLNALASAPLHALSSIAYLDKLSAKLASMYSGEGDTAWFGIEHHVGHIDYFANNGRVQPGCSGVLHICDHKRAYAIYVDLLRYELAFRRTHSPLERGQTSLEELSRTNRLYAFRSSNYEAFAAGRNFLENCPEIMSIGEHLNDEQVLGRFRNCSIPMPELARPVGDVIEALKSDHNIDFRPRNLLNHSTPAYYFKTLPDANNLVGHHYLLKVYLSSVPTWEPDHCSLQARITFNDGLALTMDLNQIMRLNESQVLAIPFIYRDHSNNLLHLIKLSQGGRLNDSWRDFEQIFQDLFPRSLTLALNEPKSTSVFGTVRDMATRMVKPNDLSNCALYIDLIEVHPLVYGLKHNFGALYESAAWLGNKTDPEARLSRRSGQDLLEMLANNPLRRTKKLGSDGESTLDLHLEAAVGSW